MIGANAELNHRQVVHKRNIVFKWFCFVIVLKVHAH